MQKNMGFLLPVLKNSQNTGVKAPTSHIFNTTMDCMLEGCGGVSEDRITLDWQFRVPLRADGFPAHPWTTVPAQGRSSLERPATPMPQRAEESLCSVGLGDLGCAVTELTGTTGPLPSTKS